MRVASLLLLTVLAGCAAEAARSRSSSGVVPAPPISGVVRRGPVPIAGARIEVCLAAGADDCGTSRATTTTDANGRFQFARGSWGTVPTYELFGPTMRLSIVESDKAEVLFEGMLVSEPSRLLILPSCDLAEGPDRGCGVAWAEG